MRQGLALLIVLWALGFSACSPSLDETAALELERRLQNRPGFDCSDLEQVTASRSGAGARAARWTFRAQCLRGDDASGPQEVFFRIRFIKIGHRWEFVDYRRLSHSEHALPPPGDIELPSPHQASYEAWVAAMFILVPVVFTALLFVLVGVLLGSGKGEEITGRAAGGIRVRPQRKLPAQRRSHWTINQSGSDGTPF